MNRGILSLVLVALRSGFCLGVGLCLGIALVSLAGAQDSKADQKEKKPPAPAQAAVVGREYSGMYSFLSDGEFVQLSVEEAGRVTGFVSRYGDKGEFVDQYFKSGKLEGSKLEFTTQTVQGVWFEFAGTVDRGEGKNAGDEGYYVLKGTLGESRDNAAKKESQVVLRMFPRSS